MIGGLLLLLMAAFAIASYYKSALLVWLIAVVAAILYGCLRLFPPRVNDIVSSNWFAQLAIGGLGPCLLVYAYIMRSAFPCFVLLLVIWLITRRFASR